jgi:hypothetical protein
LTLAMLFAVVSRSFCAADTPLKAILKDIIVSPVNRRFEGLRLA